MSTIQRYEYALDIGRQLMYSNGNRIKCKELWSMLKALGKNWHFRTLFDMKWYKPRHIIKGVLVKYSIIIKLFSLKGWDISTNVTKNKKIMISFFFSKSTSIYMLGINVICKRPPEMKMHWQRMQIDRCYIWPVPL